MKQLTLEEADAGPAGHMRQRVDDDLGHAVLLQLLPVGRLLVQGDDRRYAPLPEAEQGSLIRDDELQRHRPSPGPPDHQRVQIDVNRASDVGVREREERSAVHDEAAPALLPEDFLQPSAVDAAHLHAAVRKWLSCLTLNRD